MKNPYTKITLKGTNEPEVKVIETVVGALDGKIYRREVYRPVSAQNCLIPEPVKLDTSKLAEVQNWSNQITQTLTNNMVIDLSEVEKLNQWHSELLAKFGHK